ncbi:MAG: hypothetical protein AB1512_31560 [Thermodesulfobacteriota bacterium]
MKIKTKAEDIKRMSQVVKKVELDELFLLRSEVWRSIDALEYPQVGAELTFAGKLIKAQEKQFTARVEFALKGTADSKKDNGGEGEKVEVVKLSVDYVLVYSLADGSQFSKEDLESFCHVNAVYNAWPYWREFVQSSTGRMQLPTLMLPLLKLARPNGAGEKPQECDAEA